MSIESNKENVLLGKTIDHELKFNRHVNYMYKKTGKKLNALVRITSFMDVKKKRSIMKTFIALQFGNWPVIWMLHSRELHNKINRIHERALQITYNDKSSSFGELLNKNNSVTMRGRNLRAFAINIYKSIQGLPPSLLNEVFLLCQCSFDLPENKFLERQRDKSVRYGTESVLFFAPNVWENLHNETKDSESLQAFRKKMKLGSTKLTPADCAEHNYHK